MPIEPSEEREADESDDAHRYEAGEEANRGKCEAEAAQPHHTGHPCCLPLVCRKLRAACTSALCANGARGRAPRSAVRASLLRAHDATGDARYPNLAVLLEGAHLRNSVGPNPLPRRFVDLLKRRNCERDVLAD